MSVERFNVGFNIFQYIHKMFNESVIKKKSGFIQRKIKSSVLFQGIIFWFDTQNKLKREDKKNMLENN